MRAIGSMQVVPEPGINPDVITGVVEALLRITEPSIENRQHALIMITR